MQKNSLWTTKFQLCKKSLNVFEKSSTIKFNLGKRIIRHNIQFSENRLLKPGSHQNVLIRKCSGFGKYSTVWKLNCSCGWKPSAFETCSLNAGHVQHRKSFPNLGQSLLFKGASGSAGHYARQERYKNVRSICRMLMVTLKLSNCGKFQNPKPFLTKLSHVNGIQPRHNYS